MKTYRATFTKRFKNIKLPPDKFLRTWIFDAAREEGIKKLKLSYIFIDNETILQINAQYLNHHYYTDIITFNYSQHNDLQGEIYISIDSVADNANRYRVPFQQELLRVVIHGLLHLCGYNDKTVKQKKQMKAKEDYYLLKWNNNQN